MIASAREVYDARPPPWTTKPYAGAVLAPGTNSPSLHQPAAPADRGAQHTIDSPIGPIRLRAAGESIVEIAILDGLTSPGPADGWPIDRGPFREAVAQLDGYFAGARRNFELPLAPEGTPFQHRVWAALRTLPFGARVSYARIAQIAGLPPTSIRAVGGANSRNPISIVVPCHRVIGADGSLTGYAGGLPAKAWLLDHEARHGGAGDTFAWAAEGLRA